jgi:hypothetical protein
LKYCSNANPSGNNNLKSYENEIKSRDSLIQLLTEKNIELKKTIIHDTEYLTTIKKIYISQRPEIVNLPLDSNLSYFKTYFNDTLPKLSLINFDSLALFRKSQVSYFRVLQYDYFYLHNIDSIKTGLISDLFRTVQNDSLITVQLNEKFKIANNTVLSQDKQISDLNLKQKRLRIFGITAGSLAIIEGLILILK